MAHNYAMQNIVTQPYVVYLPSWVICNKGNVDGMTHHFTECCEVHNIWNVFKLFKYYWGGGGGEGVTQI